MQPTIQTITDVFDNRGNDSYGVEAVTQLQHALQSGLLAEEAGAGTGLVVVSLLHDIGHIFEAESLPESCDENMDDRHEFRANGWLKEQFGPEVADPVRLHVLAKRYLCTADSGHEETLSPTSRKSYHDQGGTMDAEERAAFESEPFFREALELRKWDDLAKDTDKTTPSLEHFHPALEACLKSV